MRHSCAVCGQVSQARRCAAHTTTPRTGRNPTSWGHGRDRTIQAQFRRMLIARDGLRCRACGATRVPLAAHHDTASDGRLLCNDCHREVDPYAR